jgi:tetratricopeptide repeat protein 21B
VKWYQKASEYDASDSNIRLCLAKVCAKNNDIAAAQSQLSVLIQSKSSSEEASMFMAHLSCQERSFTMAVFHYRQIIDKSPSNYIALEQYIDISRRIDKMDAVATLLKKLEEANPRTKMDPGFIFCQGLYLR